MVLPGRHRKEDKDKQNSEKTTTELEKITPPEKDGKKSRLRIPGYVDPKNKK